jgi:hypothetical protein
MKRREFITLLAGAGFDLASLNYAKRGSRQRQDLRP